MANKDHDFKRRSITELQCARHHPRRLQVLLTRGMVGTVLYAVDPQTQGSLADLLGNGDRP